MKGKKFCPSCSKGCGPRTKICECGHNFCIVTSKEKSKLKKEKVKKQKLKKKNKKEKTVRTNKIEAVTEKSIKTQLKNFSLIETEYINEEDYKECGTCFKMIKKECLLCDCGQRFNDLIEPLEMEARGLLTTLGKGDIVKVSGGPYFGKYEGRIAMGEKGLFKVNSVVNNGFLGFAKGESNLSFVYMGPVVFDNDLNLTKRPHNIKIVKKAEIEDASLSAVS